ASNANDAVLDYLTDWNEILWQVYPDYAPTGAGNLLGAAAPIDQAFILQMLIPAFEARGWTFDPATGEGTGLDLRGVAHALSVNEERIIERQQRSRRAAAAANDNQISAWRGAAFRFAGWEMAA
ncbi:MAG: hypothetical protein ACRCY3_04835, partial [Sphingorhabdus sp.]